MKRRTAVSQLLDCMVERGCDVLSAVGLRALEQDKLSRILTRLFCFVDSLFKIHAALQPSRSRDTLSSQHLVVHRNWVFCMNIKLPNVTFGEVDFSGPFNVDHS